MTASASGHVVLFHGFASSSDQTYGQTGWLRVLRRAGFTYSAPDLPGHGESSLPAPTSRRELELWALTKVEEAADRAGEPVHVIGYSLGSTLAWAASLAAPDAVGRMVFGGVPDQDHLADMAAGEDSPSTRFLESLMDQAGARGALADLIESSAAQPFSARRLLAAAEAPRGLALIAAGSEDALAFPPSEFADSLEDLCLPRPQALTIAGRDHVTVLTSGELRSAAAAALLGES
jgi:pimeloyl-ACP methyl ester carboxylesterase